MSDDNHFARFSLVHQIGELNKTIEALRAENARLAAEIEEWRKVSRESDSTLDPMRSEIKRLRAENAGLREALKPFADICRQIEGAFNVDENVSVCFGETDLSNLRAARAAMGETE